MFSLRFVYRFFEQARVEKFRGVSQILRYGSATLRRIAPQRLLVQFLSQTTIDPVDHWMDHMSVDIVGDSAGEVRCPVGHSLTRKRRSALGEQKRQRHRGQNRDLSFHRSSPSLYIN